ncbi:polyphosphate--glucose phosphotransferase [Demequina oxidasica]|uniref:polyphosphate--glucose phosphotransferase n=1 Tax=Demequina oxidasica TaxID=676199 RepID=UPI000785CA67|nr:ROK family protein [Demequina oxidasica]
MSKHIALGIDIGGSGIKGAPVNLKTGELTEDRYRIPTPDPSTPDAVARTVAQVIARFEPSQKVPVGVTFPGVVQDGIVKTAANVDDKWIGTDLRQIIRDYAGHDVVVLNDADAAGYGEYKYGAAHEQDGVVLLTTLGTGVGSALIVDGTLVRNTEFGHVEIDGAIAEEFAAESARDRHGLSMEEWTVHLQRYYSEMEKLLWPDLIIVGGGISKHWEEFLPKLALRAPIVPAELFNQAGIVGAAAHAYNVHKRQADAAKAAEKKAKKKKSK